MKPRMTQYPPLRRSKGKENDVQNGGNSSQESQICT